MQYNCLGGDENWSLVLLIFSIEKNCVLQGSYEVYVGFLKHFIIIFQFYVLNCDLIHFPIYYRHQEHWASENPTFVNPST